MQVYTLYTMEIKKFFAKRLKAVRAARGYTQGRLAEMCGLPTNAIGKYETCVIIPSLETLKKLAMALEVSADYFLFDHAKMEGVPKINDPALYERYFVLESLDEDERDAAITLLDALVAKHRLRELAGVSAESAAPKKKSAKKAAVG